MNLEAKGTNVLVVDDDQDMAVAIQDILRARAYTVILAHDGVDAIKKSHHKKIDLILLDIGMPLLSGFWFCDAFKKRAETKNIPVVIVSASRDKASIRKAYERGAAAYLKKPFHADELIDVIDQTMIKQAADDHVL